MLAMRRESDQIFGSTNSNTINTNPINSSNETVDGCCNSFQQGKHGRCIIFFFSRNFCNKLFCSAPASHKNCPRT